MEGSQKFNRRAFIRSGSTFLAALTFGSLPRDVLAMSGKKKLTILHTNDVHSRIDPFPMDGSRNQGLGGAARRSALIKKIREDEQNVLLLDSGDIFQGTPYFNLFGGEAEMELMSQMGYDAATMGNHDFDNGLDGFHKQLVHANFPIIISNYDFSDTIMHNAYLPYKIFRKAGLKIGVFGIGIELKGLVEDKNYQQTRYLDPIVKSNEMAGYLRNEQQCDLVICLSHLGYEYKDRKVSDRVLAQNTRNIDLIIGGHTHTFMAQPEDIANLDGGITTINQVGWAGINLGRIDYLFGSGKASPEKAAHQYIIANHLDS